MPRVGLYKNVGQRWGLYRGLHAKHFYNIFGICFVHTEGCPWVSRGQKQKIFKNVSFCICSQKWAGNAKCTAKARI